MLVNVSFTGVMPFFLNKLLLNDLDPVSRVFLLVLMNCAREGSHTSAIRFLMEAYLRKMV
ncbi:MAG: hypothetical protein K0S11_292 [Gammaproteobacteria bacterium]|jgi:hypothetical protein|nr:hypothetical protein [Gammaproteobacteria bacterium]